MKVIGALGAGDNSLFGLIKFPGAKRSYWVVDETGKIMDMQIGVAPRASAEKAMAALKKAAEKM